jgi:hypothetical protein
MPYKLPDETKEQYLAFKKYYSMEKPSLKVLSQDLNIPEKTLKGWFAIFQWETRMVERSVVDAEEDLDVISGHHRRILKTLREDFEARVASGGIAVETMKDYSILVKAEMDLNKDVEASNKGGGTGLEDLSREQLLDHIRQLRKKRSLQDELTLQRFIQNDPSRLITVDHLRDRTFEEAEGEQTEPVCASGAGVSRKQRADEYNEWRESLRKDNVSNRGTMLASDGGVSFVVPQGEEEDLPAHQMQDCDL